MRLNHIAVARCSNGLHLVYLDVPQQTRQSQNNPNCNERDNHADTNIKDIHFSFSVNSVLHRADFDIPLNIGQSGNYRHRHQSESRSAENFLGCRRCRTFVSVSHHPPVIISSFHFIVFHFLNAPCKSKFFQANAFS
jgi:hypothetical protein